jgi:hypothetical protein
VRKAFNEWIRDSGAYDAVVDLDRVFADPADPDRMRLEYDSGDGVHPNDAGMQAIAGAIHLDTLSDAIGGRRSQPPGGLSAPASSFVIRAMN